MSDELKIETTRSYELFHKERIRAFLKHYPNNSDVERLSWDEFDRWYPIIVEKVGEVGKAWVDHFCLELTIDRLALAEELRDELIQVGAMTAAWVDSLNEFLDERNSGAAR